MEHVEGELVLLALPERTIGVETDVAILVIGRDLEIRGHLDLLVDIGLRCQFARKVADKVIAELAEGFVEFGRLGELGEGAGLECGGERSKLCGLPHDFTAGKLHSLRPE